MKDIIANAAIAKDAVYKDVVVVGEFIFAAKHKLCVCAPDATY